MTVQVSLERRRRVEVWIDECPVGPYEPAGTEQRTFPSPASGVVAPGRLTVEASIPRGPLIMYGLLGGEYRSDPQRFTLEVRVHVSGQGLGDGTAFASHIAIRPEQPVAGLPREFATAVLDGIGDGLAQAAIAPGLLTIDCAAHGRIGSSQAIFRTLGRAIVVLLARRPQTEAELKAELELLLP